MKGADVSAVEVVRMAGRARPGDDRHIVVVTTAGVRGCYGPIGSAAAREISTWLGAAAVGQPVREHRQLLDHLTRALPGPVPPAASWAVGALDCAVWDLHGRLDDQPVAGLIAPADAVRLVPAYASWLRLDITKPATAAIAGRIAAQGWLFTKWGVRRRYTAPPAQETQRLEEGVRRIAEAVGAPVAIDALGTWTTAFGRAFAARCQRDRVHWLEDPLPHQAAARYPALADGLPLALGEKAGLRDDFAPILNNPAVIAVTLDVVGCGGLTRAVDIVAAASARRLKVYPHGRSMLPGLHLAAAFPETVAAVEYRLQWEPRRQSCYHDPITPAAGQLALPSRPGLGVSVRTL